MEVCREKAEHSSTPDLTWLLLCMCLENIVHAFHIHVHVCAVLLFNYLGAHVLGEELQPNETKELKC